MGAELTGQVSLDAWPDGLLVRRERPHPGLEDAGVSERVTYPRELHAARDQQLLGVRCAQPIEREADAELAHNAVGAVDRRGPKPHDVHPPAEAFLELAIGDVGTYTRGTRSRRASSASTRASSLSVLAASDPTALAFRASAICTVQPAACSRSRTHAAPLIISTQADASGPRRITRAARPSSSAGAQPSSITTSYKHSVLTYDKSTSTLRWYVDGALDATYSDVVFPANVDVNRLELGRGDQFANESLDEVAIYDRALTSQGIATRYAIGTGQQRMQRCADIDGATSTRSVVTAADVGATLRVRVTASNAAGPRSATSDETSLITTATKDGQPSTSQIACNGTVGSTGWHQSAVTVTLTATDAQSGVSEVRYTLDGSDPSFLSSVYSGPFTVAGTMTLKYRAWDNAGNAETTRSHLVQVDGVGPVSSMSCNGSPCLTGWYTAPVTVRLSAVDAGSGVASIRYTLDGSEPSGASALYTEPFVLASTTTVRYEAGTTQEMWRSQFPVGTGRFAASDCRDNVACRRDEGQGHGQDHGQRKRRLIGNRTGHFYASGALIDAKADAPYTVSWSTSTLKGHYTLTAVAEDNAGNRYTSPAVVVTV